MLELLKTHRFPIGFVSLSLFFGTLFYGNSGVMRYSPLVSPFGMFSNIMDSEGGSGDILPKCDSRIVSKELLRLMNDTPRARRGGFEAKSVLSAEPEVSNIINEALPSFNLYLNQSKNYSEAEKNQLISNFLMSSFNNYILKNFNDITPERKKLINEFLQAYVEQIERNCSLQVTTNDGEKTVSLQITWVDEKSKRPKFNATWR